MEIPAAPAGGPGRAASREAPNGQVGYIMQFGMPTLIENRTLEENIALCTRLGLRFIELNMNFPEYQLDRLEDTGILLKAAQEAGIY